MHFRPPRQVVRPLADAMFNDLQQEILEEKASTLERLTREFEKALAAFREFEAGGGRPDEARYAELRDAAAKALWWFVVQREACGLRNTEMVMREYKVPGVVRVRLGVAGAT